MRHFTYSGNLEDAIEKAERDLQKEKENKEIAQWYWLYEKAKKAISAHNKKIANIEAFIRCAEEEQEKQKQRHCTTFCMDTGTPPEMQPRGYGIFRRRHMGRYLP